MRSSFAHCHNNSSNVWFLFLCRVSSVKNVFFVPLCLPSLPLRRVWWLIQKLKMLKMWCFTFFSFFAFTLSLIVNSSHPAPCKLFCLIKIFCSYFSTTETTYRRESWEMKLCKKAKVESSSSFFFVLHITFAYYTIIECAQGRQQYHDVTDWGMRKSGFSRFNYESCFAECWKSKNTVQLLRRFLKLKS